MADVSWRETLDLLPVAGSCFVMIIAQSAATSRVYATMHKERVDENADILGLAAANAAAAVSGAFVVNGSPTQTAMADEAGARSQVAQLAFAAVVLVVLLFLTGPLQYLPHCVLASIVFTIAVGMVNVQGLSDIRRESPGEFLLALFTAAVVPAIGVEQGILLAIALSLVQHVRHSYQPHTMVLAPGATGQWEPAPATPGSQTEPDSSSTGSARTCSTRMQIASPTRCALPSTRRPRRSGGSSSTPARSLTSTIRPPGLFATCSANSPPRTLASRSRA
jgi:SulP family sulfate permease